MPSARKARKRGHETMSKMITRTITTTNFKVQVINAGGEVIDNAECVMYGIVNLDKMRKHAIELLNLDKDTQFIVSDIKHTDHKYQLSIEHFMELATLVEETEGEEVK
jgi:hypothetical protein